MYLIAFLSFLMHVGNGGGRVVLSLAAIQFGATPAQIGLMVSLMAVFSTVLAVPLGRLSDRIGVRLPMMVGSAGIGIALLLPLAVPALGTLFVTAVLMGIGFTSYQVSVTNLTGAIGPPEQRARNYSILSLGFAAATFLGPLVAGFCIDWLGHRWTFGVLCAWAVLPLPLMLAFKRLVPNVHKRAAGSAGGSVLDLLKSRPLRDTFVAGGIISSAWDLYQFVMPIYGHSLGLSASVIGMVLAVFALAILLVRVALPMLTRRHAEPRLITAAILVAGAAFAALPFVRDPWLLAAVSFVLGLGVGCGQPLSMTLIYNLAPPGRAGEASGVRVSVNHLTHVIVPVAFGSVGAVLGFGPVFALNAAILLACGGYSHRHYLR